MRIVHSYEAEVDYCAAFKRVWLDRGEIDKMADGQRMYEEDHYNKYHSNRNYDEHHSGFDCDFADEDDYYGSRYCPRDSDRVRRRGFLQDLFDFD